HLPSAQPRQGPSAIHSGSSRSPWRASSPWPRASWRLAEESVRYAGPGSNCPAASLHVRGACAADSHLRHARGAAHPDRHLSGHSDSGDQRRVAIHRPAARPDERPHHDSVRARAHHDGERYRAHRRRLVCRLWCGQDLLPADRRHPHGERAGHLCLADPAEADARRDHPTAGAQLQRFHRAHHPARARGEGVVRADLVGSRHQHDPHSAHHRAGRVAAAAVRRQDARSADRSGPRGSPGAGPVGSGCGARARDAESGPAGGHPEDRQVRIHDAAEQLPYRHERLSDLPIKAVNGAMIYLRDVAQVRDGYPPQTNIVHVDGGRSVLLIVEKSGATSTLAIIQGIKAKMAQLKAILPAALTVAPIGDQSVFVTGAISSVVREGVIAAALTSLMILLFLGSWRSTLIIATSIPLAVLGSVTALSVLGETLNIMTLGGLALAVGILVDDATVTIENINWHLE